MFIESLFFECISFLAMNGLFSISLDFFEFLSVVIFVIKIVIDVLSVFRVYLFAEFFCFCLCSLKVVCGDEVFDEVDIVVCHCKMFF